MRTAEPLDVTLPIPIIVVSFRNPDDLLECLAGVAAMRADPAFDVYVCENGGPAAFETLCQRLDASTTLLAAADNPAPCDSSAFVQTRGWRFAARDSRLFIGLSPDNSGYGGGINTWLRPLLAAGDWPGVFVLNPDASPTPDALFHLKSYAESKGRGMVSGRIVWTDTPQFIQTRGLRWNPIKASNISIGRNAPADEMPDIDLVERTIDSTSGAALYATRACIDRIGLMTEHYFLYYEDIDWGMRAKAACGLGYAFDAVVYHKGGTTIGGGSRKTASPLSTFLEFRNRILFVAALKPRWYLWTVAISLVRAMEYAAVGRPGITLVALRGVVEGVLGRSGRPDHILASLMRPRR